MKRDIELLEKVQQRAIRLTDEFKVMHYVDMRKVGLSTLETRRLRGLDLSQEFQDFKGV